MVPYRESFRLAVPLILSNLTVPLLGMVDTAVVGRLPGAHHLGAVALGAAIMSMLLWVHGFLRMGTGGLTAQAFGADDALEIRVILVRSASVALISGLLMILAAPLLIAGAHLLFAPTEDVIKGLDPYLAIRLMGLPAAFSSHVAVGWFLGQQRPLVPLVMMLTANGLNAVLDIVLVLYLGFGVEGVAIATVIAEYSALLVACLFAFGAWRRLPAHRMRLRKILDRAAILRFFRLSRDLLLRTALMQAVFLGFAAIGTRQGDLVLAANAVLMNFFTLQAHGLDGFADATEAMTGRAVGRRSALELRQATRAGFVNAGLLALGLTLLFVLAGAAIVNLLTTLPEVREAAYSFLPYVAALPLVSVWAFVMDGVFFGATRGSEMRNAMLLAVLAFVVTASMLTPMLGNHGLWIAFLVFMGARGLLLGLTYWRADRGAAFARP